MANTAYSPLKSIAQTPSPSRYRRMKSSQSTPDLKSAIRFLFGRQSSLAPSDCSPDDVQVPESVQPPESRAGFILLYYANKGDLEGVTESLDTGVDIHFRDMDERTALHLASCRGQTEIVQLLIDRGAEVDAPDRWGGTPLADAIYYEHQDVVKLLQKCGAKTPAVKLVSDAPEYEIPPREIDLTNSYQITKGTFRVAEWRGIKVAVKVLPDHFIMDEEILGAFRDELIILEKLRHPNVVQFIGAITQSAPLTIITEYLPEGDLRALLDCKGALKPSIAVKYALDIARGLNYLHKHKPEPIIHRDLEPSNILREDSGHLKLADFGLSKLQKAAKADKEDRSMAFQEFSWRYVAPEVFRDEEFDTKVDVFSFALIVQEMIEGIPPFPSMLDRDVPKAYCDGHRPPFKASEKKYPYRLRMLIERCWNEDPSKRPPFYEIVEILNEMVKKLEQRKRFKLHFAVCGCFSKVKSKDEENNASPSSHASVSVVD